MTDISKLLQPIIDEKLEMEGFNARIDGVQASLLRAAQDIEVDKSLISITDHILNVFRDAHCSDDDINDFIGKLQKRQLDAAEIAVGFYSATHHEQ